jgi:hypothetical protein
MTSMDPPRTSGDDATAPAPRIVNGLTVRPREKVILWYVGFFFLPDFLLLFVGVGFGMHRLMRYLDNNRPLDEASKSQAGD